MPRDHLDARFERHIRRQERNKTGLSASDTNYYECTKCKTMYRGGHPERCTSWDNPMNKTACENVEFKRYVELEIEAMPIGRVYIDMRRKGW